MDLLDKLVTYLAPLVGLTAGTSLFYNEIPPDSDVPSSAMCVQEAIPGDHVFPQIDAEIHILKVTARADTSIAAKSLASLAYVQCYDETGIVTLATDLIVSIELGGTPIWEKTDQEGRSYFYFTMKVISKRLL